MGMPMLHPWNSFPMQAVLRAALRYFVFTKPRKATLHGLVNTKNDFASVAAPQD